MSDNGRYDNLPATVALRYFLLGTLAGAAAAGAAWLASQLWADHVLLLNVIRFLETAGR